MRRISAKERKKAGHIYCRYCKPSKVDAVWREDGGRIQPACEKHKDQICEVVDDGYMTEADYKTWGRL